MVAAVQGRSERGGEALPMLTSSSLWGYLLRASIRAIDSSRVSLPASRSSSISPIVGGVSVLMVGATSVGGIVSKGVADTGTGTVACSGSGVGVGVEVIGAVLFLPK